MEVEVLIDAFLVDVAEDAAVLLRLEAFFGNSVFLVEQLYVLVILELLEHPLDLFPDCWLVLYVAAADQDHQTCGKTVLGDEVFEH